MIVVVGSGGGEGDNAGIGVASGTVPGGSYPRPMGWRTVNLPLERGSDVVGVDQSTGRRVSVGLDEVRKLSADDVVVALKDFSLCGSV